MSEPVIRHPAAVESQGEGCPECGGRGWLVERGVGAGSARPCPCHLAGAPDRMVEATGIPERYRGCRLERFQVRGVSDPGARRQLTQALAVARRYVEEFIQPGGGFRETGLLFIGPPGVGKTHLAVAVLGELVRTYRRRGRFVDFTSLIHQIQSSFDTGSPDSKREILDAVVEAEVLVLDELGAQKPTEWVRDTLYLIINARYTRRLPTLFTTNFRLDPEPGDRQRSLDRGADPPLASGFGLLSTRIPPMLVSRLHEMTQPVLLTAVADYREEIGKHRHRISP